MKIILFILIFSFHTCTYLATNPPMSKSSNQFDDPVKLFLLFTILNNSGCSGNGKFWVRDITSKTGSTYCVESNLVASTIGADFYLQKGLSPGIDFSNVASEFKSKISPALDSAIGVASDINKDGKIVVLTLDIRDGATANSGFVAGFVDPINFTQDNLFSTARSNQMEILYMDGVELAEKRKKSLADGDPDPFLGTIAHELQHLIRFRYSLGGDITWIDEGTSEVMSDIAGFGPQVDRLKCFKGEANSGCTTNPIGVQGTSPFTWGSSLRNYAYSYAFMRYLYYSSGGSSTTRNLFLSYTVQSKNNFRGSDSYSLMEVFKNSSGYINNNGSTYLTSDTTTMFKRLLTYFMGKSQGYTSFTSSDVFMDGSGISLANVDTYFPLNYTVFTLPSSVTNLKFSATTNGSTASLTPGSVYLRSGTLSTNPLPIAGSGPSYIKNGNTDYISLNPAGSGSSISASQYASVEAEETEIPVLHEGVNCISRQLMIREVRARSNAHHRYLFDTNP
jgi:hypothetical protein